MKRFENMFKVFVKLYVCDFTVKLTWTLVSYEHSTIFSSPDPKGHVSYSHHLASVVVVRRTS